MPGGGGLHQERILEYNGVKGTVRWWAKQLGIVHTTLWRRLKKCNWDLEEACKAPIKEAGTMAVEIDGVVRSRRQWCIYYGISPSTVQARIKWGWDVVRALTTPSNAVPRGRKSKRSRDYKSLL